MRCSGGQNHLSDPAWIQTKLIPIQAEDANEADSWAADEPETGHCSCETESRANSA